MKKLFLLFAALCCTAMMQAEIVHHEKCHPTYTTIGYTQECWEDTKTGKLYAERSCTNELNRVVVVTYKKLLKNPIVSENHTVYESIEKEGCVFNWAAEQQLPSSSSTNSGSDASFEFKVYGEDVANARIKWWQDVHYFGGSWGGEHSIHFSINVNNKMIYDVEIRERYPDIKGPYPSFEEFPLPDLQRGDVVKIDMSCKGSQNYAIFAASLEYTSSNGGDPDAILIIPDDKRKFKGAEDPELTYYIHYPTYSTEKLTDISISRTQGEEPGFYPIHVSYAEPANPDCVIRNFDGVLEIVDGVYHAQGETLSDGLIYLQDCWEETSTGKFYTDGHLEYEIKHGFNAVVGYPRLQSNPVTATDGFTVKESTTYDGVPFDWAAETQYSSHTDTGTRSVEFTVMDCGISNARLKWYIDHGEVGYGPFTITISVNNNPVETYTQTNDESLTGFHTVSLPGLKHGDVVKFEVQKPSKAKWAGAPLLAACLEYVFPQDLCFTAQEAGSTVELKKNGSTVPVEIQYSTDYSNWTTVDFSSATTTGTITLANVGDMVYFRKADEGVASRFSNSDYQYSFAMTGKIVAGGNVMSLIDNSCEAKTIPNEYCFAKLFYDCESLTSAPRLPAKTLKKDCYWWMFSGCKNLTTAPELPATTLQYQCYERMFYGCEKLNHIKVGYTSWLHNADPTLASYTTTTDWLYGVSETGTFVCPDALDKTQAGANYIPEGWTPVFEAKANKDPESKNYYATFYSGTNAYEVPEGVTAYTGVVEDESVLKLTPVADGIIPAEEPVIMIATQSQIYLPYTAEKGTKSDDNKLDGTDVKTTLGANQYALFIGQNGVGFYLWEGKSIGAHKAYLTLDEQTAKVLTFDFNDVPTGINCLTPALSEGEGAIYNLNGVRVNEGYKGIVIKNGKKILVR